MDFYLQGLALGLAYVAPIGMQNLFVINSALTQTRLRALVTALIVIFFDVTLALACFFGIGLVMQKYPPVQLGILLLGGLVVVYIGVSLLKSSVRQIGGAQQMPLGKTVWAACVVTWFNAQAVIDGTMLLGAFKASMTEAQSLHFLFGVLSASCLWFITLAMVVSLAGSLVTPRVLGVINKICGAVIAIYGLRLLWHFAEAL
ncbi:LysE family transporter [Phascolarctobacterium faecium]|nr:LysE family transporter [Phascolarctobacterium faecium]MDM8109534.1 LysE family transporter [Phascolarctobacterium faecium]